jgi:nucleotide-binding universal stress UspA family protein
MAGPIVLCTDGSELAERALAAGLTVVASDAPRILAAVVEVADPTLVTGSGMAGGVMSVEELDSLDRAAVASAREAVEHTASELGLSDVRTELLRGEPGPTICEFAAEVGAAAVVIGSRGRGGFKRALLGSVSDYVVRNAPCPVVVTSHPGD